MKRRLLYLIVLSVLVVSCDPYQEATPLTVDQLETATLRIHLFADLDLSSSGYENAPSGTSVVVKISNYELVGVSSGYWVGEAQVNSEGVAEIEVPVGLKNSTSIGIYPVSFEYDQVPNSGSVIPSLYQSSGLTITSYTGQTEIVQAFYYATPLGVIVF